MDHRQVIAEPGDGGVVGDQLAEDRQRLAEFGLGLRCLAPRRQHSAEPVVGVGQVAAVAGMPGSASASSRRIATAAR